MLNEHLDRSPPQHVAATVDTKFTRYNPLPIAVVGVQLADGKHANVDVLNETWDKLTIDSRLDLVEKRGLLGKNLGIKTKHFTRASTVVAYSKVQYTSVCRPCSYIFASVAPAEYARPARRPWSPSCLLSLRSFVLQSLCDA